MGKFKPRFPGYRYGPNGEAEAFQNAEDVPEGWEDHPSKHEKVLIVDPKAEPVVELTAAEKRAAAKAAKKAAEAAAPTPLEKATAHAELLEQCRAIWPATPDDATVEEMTANLAAHNGNGS